MTSKERILAAFEHREADRVPMWESFWPSTMERWKSEGLAEGTDLNQRFGLDPANHTGIDWTAQFPTEVVEETDEYIIVRTANGTLSKDFKHHATTPHWSDYPLRDRATWEELKPRMQWNESRINLPAAKTRYEETRDLLQVYFPACCGFEKFKYIMGPEGILIAMAEDPEWALEMFMSTAELCINGLEYLLANGFEFDAAFITEDMGFKGRGFFSPRAYREMIMPAQKRFADFCHARGMKFMLHTCGMNMELVPLYIEAGVDILNPLEVKAGMDMLKLKKDFGEVLTLWGGIDVRAISNPEPAVLEAEIRDKVTFAKQGGGYVFSSDHSIPEDVSIDRYDYMVDLGRKYGSF